MNPAFWKNKRVLITGHTGFKGSWLALWLQNMGADLTGYALPPPTTPNLFTLAQVTHGMRSIEGDIRDFASLKQIISETQPEIIFHLAAQALVRYSYQTPVETYAVNVMGTVHLLEAARTTASVRAIVNVTSDKCYANQEWCWGYRENEPMGGNDPYSSSKGCAELITAAYRTAYFQENKLDHPRIALASVRAGNVIGGGDWAMDRLIPDILCALEKNQPVVIRYPNAIRPWQHVLDALYGYLLLAEKLYSEEGSLYAEGWNFGPAVEDARPVQWIVDYLSAAWGEGASWQLDNQPQPHEAHYLKLDCTKSRSKLNWQPRWNLESALNAVVTWHKSYLQKDNMQQQCLRQINEFL